MNGKQQGATVLLACLFFAFGDQASRAAGTITIQGGQVADATPDSSGVRAFKGLPYAAPPLGQLRWRAPEAVKPWEGVKSATEWGPRCMQGDRLGNLDPLNKRMDEDCLYLNVWSPAKSADKLPVMVFIHGGSNNLGAGSQPEYDGTNLARQGVVVVTINYRLDVFGFLAHPELTKESGTNASGNYGLLDQIAALKWVQANIAAFGGDPARVTVFGESAGAFDISLLVASPLAKGLFVGAIGESGGALTPIPALGPKPLQVGESDGTKFVASLGASSVTDLREKPAAEILQAAIKAPIIYGFGVVDGYVVPDHPARIYAAGKHNDVPLLIGWNADEGTLFAARVKWGEGTPSYVERVRTQYKDQADAVLKLYPAGTGPDEDKHAFATLFGDQLIGYGAWAWAERASQLGKSPVYRYYFTRRPPGAPELSINPLTAPGVYHSAELYYVFDNLKVREWPWSAEDRRLAQAMSSYFVNFAKTGSPNDKDLPQWPSYKAGGNGQVMELGSEIAPRGEPTRARYELFDAIYAKASSP